MASSKFISSGMAETEWSLHPPIPSFFGATGDLTHEKIFCALQALAQRGNLKHPAGQVDETLRVSAQFLNR
jgi:hypothetical protein